MAHTPQAAGLTAIARILTTVGLKGDLKVELLCSGPERLERCTAVSVGPSPETATAHRFLGVRVQPNGVLVRISEVSDRTSAERLRGHYLFVTDAEVEPPAPGAVRIDELIGYAVVDREGRARGTVREVLSLPANDVWVVWTGSADVLVPAVAAWVERVDRDSRTVVLAMTEGLFDG